GGLAEGLGAGRSRHSRGSVPGSAVRRRLSHGSGGRRSRCSQTWKGGAGVLELRCDCRVSGSVSEARRPAAHHVEWELRRIVRKAAARARLSGTDSRRGQSPVSFISARKRFPVPWLFHHLVLLVFSTSIDVIILYTVTIELLVY